MVRMLVIGGAGALGARLCTQLVEAGHHVIALDDFSTGTPENVAHLARAWRFDLVRHDVGAPFYLEVDHIYHLAKAGTDHARALARKTGARVVLAAELREP